MPKIIFTEEFQYRPTKEYRVTMVYKPSRTPQVVNEECAKQAVELGKGRLHAEKKSKIQREPQEGSDKNPEGDAEGS